MNMGNENINFPCFFPSNNQSFDVLCGNAGWSFGKHIVKYRVSIPQRNGCDITV